MSRSVQTMTFMPLASVVDCTWSSAGHTRGAARLAGLVAAPVAAPNDSNRRRAQRANDRRLRHAAPRQECALYTGYRKEKRRTRGKSFAAPKKRTPGKSCSQSFLRCDLLRRYLETLTAWIAVSWARASRASMGANITLPPRRRLTIIPAIAGRMLATPCAWGRISVTVDLAITV